MSKKLTLVLTLAMAVLPGAAYALGLGEIKLNSALNDKFSADIQVVGATSDELDSLDVKLASLAQFSQAGLDHPEVLAQLQFVVVRNADGTAYVHITSTQAVREPFLDFLIDANWNNGELIREYTVLLNPQSFQTASAPKPEAAAAPAPVPATVAAAASAPAVAAPVPVSAPAPAPAEAQAATPAPAQPEAAVAAAEQPASPAPQPAASPPPAPTPAVETAPAQRALGANYGPIHRGETLSSIAKQVRPDGVTLNQMMIAIYQANSEVFVHNINRMKAGYILRMPTASDVQAVSVADANAEVRAQMEAWRSNRSAAPAASTSASAQPALQLVAPSSAAESSAPVPGAEKQGNGEAAAKGEKPAESAAATTEEPVNPAPAPAPAAPPANQAPLTVKNSSMAAVQQQAAQQAAQPAPSVLPPPEPAKNTPLATTPAAAKPAPATAQESGGGFLDAILNIYVLGAIVVVAVIVLLGVVIKKRKKAPSAFNPSGTARIKGADWMKQEQAGGNDDATEAASSTTRTRSKMKKAAKAPEPEKPDDKTVLVARPTESAGDDSDKTMLMSAPPQMMQDTMVGGGGGGGQLDVSDPMAEADFHMAYGLYDQAADVLRKALRQSPDRHDIQVKLLEVFFTAGDRDNFVAEAKKLRESIGTGPSKEWDSVAIMGRQVAPNETLFTSSGAASGGTVDIALGAGGTDTVVSDLGDAFSASHMPPAAPEPAPAPAAPADNLMEFSLPDIEPTPAAPAAEAPKTGGGMEFDLGDLNFEPTPAKKGKEEKAAPTLGTDEPTVATDFGTDSQVEFDKALNDLAAFVNTNVPAQPEAGAGPAGGGELSMDDSPAPAMAAAGGDEPAGSSISEIGTKLDLARAYIDMGDPDGAKSILAEVTSEGNAQQKQEAQELLKHLG